MTCLVFTATRTCHVHSRLWALGSEFYGHVVWPRLGVASSWWRCQQALASLLTTVNRRPLSYFLFSLGDNKKRYRSSPLLISSWNLLSFDSNSCWLSYQKRPNPNRHRHHSLLVLKQIIVYHELSSRNDCWFILFTLSSSLYGEREKPIANLVLLVHFFRSIWQVVIYSLFSCSRFLLSNLGSARRRWVVLISF